MLHPRKSWIALLLFPLLFGCDTTAVEAPVLTPPFLLRPLDTGSVTVEAPLLFSWEAVPNAARYELEIRHGSSEEPYVKVAYTRNTHLSVIFETPGAHSWRVRARNEANAAGSWSEARAFIVQPRPDEGASP